MTNTKPRIIARDAAAIREFSWDITERITEFSQELAWGIAEDSKFDIESDEFYELLENACGAIQSAIFALVKKEV